MELIIVIMSANTFTDIMYYTMDSGEMETCLFFILDILVLTVWLLNILVAFLFTSFEIADKKFKEKVSRHSSEYEGLPIRLVKGFWKYFQYKANKKNLPAWSLKALWCYKKIEPLFINLIVADLILRCIISKDLSNSDMRTFFKVDKALSIVLFVEYAFRVIAYSTNPWKFITKIDYMTDLMVAILTFTVSLIQYNHDLGQTYYWFSIFHISRF